MCVVFYTMLNRTVSCTQCDYRQYSFGAHTSREAREPGGGAHVYTL